MRVGARDDEHTVPDIGAMAAGIEDALGELGRIAKAHRTASRNRSARG